MAIDFNGFAAKGNLFVSELAKELGYSQDTDRAGRVLRSVLHTLRDLITVEESVQLLAQLPMFLKAVYVENWSLRTKKKKIKHLQDFYEQVAERGGLVASTKLESDYEVDLAVSVVFLMLRKYVSMGEMEDIRAVLPKDLKPLISTVIML